MLPDLCMQSRFAPMWTPEWKRKANPERAMFHKTEGPKDPKTREQIIASYPHQHVSSPTQIEPSFIIIDSSTMLLYLVVGVEHVTNKNSHMHLNCWLQKKPFLLQDWNMTFFFQKCIPSTGQSQCAPKTCKQLDQYINNHLNLDCYACGEFRVRLSDI